MDFSEFDKAYLGCFPELNGVLYRQAFSFTTIGDQKLVLDFVNKKVRLPYETIAFSQVLGGRQYEMRVYRNLESSIHDNFIHRELIYLDNNNIERSMRINIKDKVMDGLFWILVSTIRK